ncbi:MAG: polyprenyl synthetase family protein [Deltaproteobacteria bacterium]|nr:polyprenyl synthetase family protein [Deltaproteobacteria bacterium]
MKELKAYLLREKEPIEASIRQALAGLHPLVRPVAEHVLLAGGKRLRPLLVILSARAGGYDGPDLHALAAALELFHSATLIHDDILDHAETRRGQASTHLEFGLTESVLAGDVLLALANRIVARTGNPALTECVSEAIQETAVGEMLEIAQGRIPDFSEDDYLKIIIGKTAFLIQAAAEFGAILAGRDDQARAAAREFGRHVGIAFQLVDDALDFEADSEHLGKPAGTDLREGKLTLPAILYLKTLESEVRNELVAEITSRRLDHQTLGSLADAIDKGGFSGKTRTQAEEYIAVALKALPAFASGSEARILAQMAQYITTRQR